MGQPMEGGGVGEGVLPPSLLEEGERVKARAMASPITIRISKMTDATSKHL